MNEALVFVAWLYRDEKNLKEMLEARTLDRRHARLLRVRPKARSRLRRVGALAEWVALKTFGGRAGVDLSRVSGTAGVSRPSSCQIVSIFR